MIEQDVSTNSNSYFTYRNNLATYRMTDLTPQKSDQCACIHVTVSNLTFVAIHIDDMTIVSSLSSMSYVKAKLGKNFKVSDLREIKQVVRLKITRNKRIGTTIVSKTQDISWVLERFDMANSNPAPTPLDLNVKLTKLESKASGKISSEIKSRYQSMIRSLIYMALGMRPDIRHTVQALSQFSSNPGEQHLTAAK